MIKRKFVFTLSLLLLIFSLLIFKTEMNVGLTAMSAVAQLSDDLAVNSLARSVVRGDFFNWINTALMSLGAIGIIFSFIPKKKKVDKEN